MASDHQEKQPKKVEHGVRDMVSAIMSRIPDLHHKPGSSSHHQDDDERGIRVVTLAGNNIGASLKTDQPGDHDKSGAIRDHPDGRVFFGEDSQSDAMNTYVNSNFQAINNSIMMGGKYEANDPGVHLDITDVVDNINKGNKFHKHGKKGKKMKNKKKVQQKEKEKEKEEQGSSSSDDDDDESSDSSSDGKQVRDDKPKKEGGEPPLQQRVAAP